MTVSFILKTGYNFNDRCLVIPSTRLTISTSGKSPFHSSSTIIPLYSSESPQAHRPVVHLQQVLTVPAVFELEHTLWFGPSRVSLRHAGLQRMRVGPEQPASSESSFEIGKSQLRLWPVPPLRQRQCRQLHPRQAYLDVVRLDLSLSLLSMSWSPMKVCLTHSMTVSRISLAFLTESIPIRSIE
jgi:hypothetical protein